MRKDWEARREEITRMDRELWAQGRAFAGIDEAGRGPLCGPVAAACVVMPPEPLLLYVDDSKKLTEKRREALYDKIMETAVYARVALAWLLAETASADAGAVTAFLRGGIDPFVRSRAVRKIRESYKISAADKAAFDDMLRDMKNKGVDTH